jgi:hypothetical protein
MTTSNKIKWILCKLGINRACKNVTPDELKASPSIDDLRKRQHTTAERLKYLGYYVDIYTGHVQRVHKDDDVWT